MLVWSVTPVFGHLQPRCSWISRINITIKFCECHVLVARFPDSEHFISEYELQTMDGVSGLHAVLRCGGIAVQLSCSSTAVH